MRSQNKLNRFIALSVFVHVACLVIAGLLPNENRKLSVSFVDKYKPLQIVMNAGVRAESAAKPASKLSSQQHFPGEKSPAPKRRPTSLSALEHKIDIEKLIPVDTELTSDSHLSNTVFVELDNTRFFDDSAQPASQDAIQSLATLEAKNALIQEKLNALLKSNFTYPGFAVKRGWQGTVKLGLRIEANGQLTHVRIIKTSGYRILDQAAITTLTNTNFIYGIEQWLAGNYFDTTLPVKYQLVDG